MTHPIEIQRGGEWEEADLHLLNEGDRFRYKDPARNRSGVYCWVVIRQPVQFTDENNKMAWEVDCIPIPMNKICSAHETIDKLKDELVQLVIAFNRTSSFKEAADTQDLILQLDVFQKKHELTTMVWPPSLVGKDGDLWIKTTADVEEDEEPKVETLEQAGIS